MPKTRDRLLTPAEATAILGILNLGWADYQALSEAEHKTYGFGKRWLDAARRAHFKIAARAAKKNRSAEEKVESHA